MNKKIDYKAELNSAQLQAVESTEGPHLVIAGAGSGKTRVLVYRVAYLVEKGVRPQEILLLTFTRRAAGEMLDRAAFILDERCANVSGGTFHSFANMILRKHAQAVGIKNNFTILDQDDAQDAIGLIRAQLGFGRAEKKFPKKSTIFEVISKSINKSEDIEVILYNEYPHFMEHIDDIKKIREEYTKHKRSKSLLDYDDLLVFLRELLSADESLRQKLKSQYRYIMVDEYQDTNKLQASITYLLSCGHKNIMVVGDDAQSIYSFRGANFKNIMEFPKVFPGTKIITLNENYRSTQPILNLTNEVIKMAQEKFDKNLYTSKKGMHLPVFVDVRDEHEQSIYVADKISELQNNGVRSSDIAVLFRSGWHSNDLEIELAARKIPFVKYGGQKFIEASHIKDIIACLRIVHNVLDILSWRRTLLLLPGVGPKTADTIFNQIASQEKRLVVEDKLLNKTKGLREYLKILKKADAVNHKPREIVEAFIHFYKPLLQENYDDYNKRLNDLDSLLEISKRYKKLEDFLVDMSLEPPERNIVESERNGNSRECVRLSTIHSAKGLEWHTVFLIYAADGHLPSYLSLENQEEIEEERRLLYVATTRAKENLFLLKPRIERAGRGFMSESGFVLTRMSRFLEEANIIGRFAKREGMLEDNIFDDLEIEDIIADNRGEDSQTLLRRMKEYFRDLEEY